MPSNMHNFQTVCPTGFIHLSTTKGKKLNIKVKNHGLSYFQPNKPRDALETDLFYKNWQLDQFVPIFLHLVIG